MPELPEVETIRQSIAPSLQGQIIQTVMVREPRLRWSVPSTLATCLEGQTIHDIQRRGKYLLFQCDQGHLLVHLGMSGNLWLLPAQTPVNKHDHLDIVFANQLCLRYHDPRRFGCVLWTSEPILQHPLLINLGPEPLEPDFSGNYLYHVAQQRKVPVKTYIMNSRVVVGVGNIYANESLFVAGIHPTKPSGQISLERYQSLAKSIQQVLSIAIESGGTTLRDFRDSTGKPGYFKPLLQIYGRTGQPCNQCGKPIQQQKLAQRATYYCSICQS
jgi:formamidopyrimidine-DNA glycosylase